MKRIFRWILKVLFWFAAVSVGSVILFRFVPVPVTPLMLIRTYEQWSDDKELSLYKEWVPLEAVSDNLVMAVIAAEDQKFSEHFGIDMDAIEKAQKYNARKKGSKVRGASTISQQTAKNVFLWPDRSWVRKGFEVYFTVLIELFWSKERIMEVYLNVIEMGDGVYGAEAAAQTYFRKPASKLTLPQAALIAACLPNPRKWNPARPTAYISKKKNWIVRQARNLEKPAFLSEADK